ncbi:ADP-ribosyltransferase [Rhodococcoides fascians]|uniref:ADP-ribosyltransferase n=1 Tax=Rhodococcoides fascians TaxID=1828 RepID=UPI001E3F5944|nr:ADP-ribosyltransferase [Rhodococcus fascians]
MSFPHYVRVMCRSKSHGTGRRCPGCGSYESAAKANGNRRLSREARKKVVDHLKGQGMVDTAAAIQAAPPSVLKEFLEGMGIDPEILGKTPMPSTHANPPSAKLLIAQAKAEREKLTGPKVTAAQATLAGAEEKVVQIDAEADQARKAVNRYRARRRKAVLALQSGTGSEGDVAEQNKLLEDAKSAYALSQQRQTEAREDLAVARFGLREDIADEAARDAYYAALTDDEIAAIGRSLNRRYEEQADTAISTGPGVGPAEIERDTSVYNPGTIPMETGSGVEQVEGRYLDGGTAIYRRGSSDFMVLQRKDGAYHPVAHAHSKSDALAKANRIPIMVEAGELPQQATEIERQAHSIKGDAVLTLAKKSAEGLSTTNAGHRKIIDHELASAKAKLADSVGAGPVRAEIYDGVKRHSKRLRELAAVEAGEKARSAALAAGKTSMQADEEYARAHRRALGTPTRGGGVIPFFDHKIPPDSLGAAKHAALYRSGIRAFGKETCEDYEVIKQRAGNLSAWGFAVNGNNVQTSNISSLTESNSAFVKKVLTGSERSALTTYTGGSYQSINAAVTGRDPNPPSHIKTVVSGIESSFDKFDEHNPNKQPMTVMRGTRVPSGWTGTATDYIDAAFTVGSKMQIGKVTSCTTRQSTATSFASQSSTPYMMVIRTRNGLPVKSISSFSSEDEVIVPTGTNLRCVKVDHKGVGGLPTVWLVAEDLVAEAEGGPTPLKSVA